MKTLSPSLSAMAAYGGPSSLGSFERALASLFRADGGALPIIEAALERDPTFVAGHCLRAVALVLGGADSSLVALDAAVTAIEATASAAESARQHAVASRCWLDGDIARAADVYGELVRDDPRDRLALLAAHGLDFRLGRRELLRDRMAGVLRHWDPSEPEYGYLLGMQAFGFEETGDYERALKLAQRSLELIPDNAAAIHVIAHVYEMRGPPDQGIAWLQTTQPIWAQNPGYRVHLAWHLALFELDADAAANALATYDELIAPNLDGSNNGLVDATALLWRLQLCGIGLQWRWQDVGRLWMRRDIIGSRAFELVHVIMALAASSQLARAHRFAQRLEEDPMLRARSARVELATAGPLIAAVMAFCRGDYDAAVESISAIRAAVDRCGGSVAQCDLINLTLLEAALRGQRQGLAQRLVAERAVRKPASRLNRRLNARAWTLGPARLAT